MLILSYILLYYIILYSVNIVLLVRWVEICWWSLLRNKFQEVLEKTVHTLLPDIENSKFCASASTKHHCDSVGRKRMVLLRGDNLRTAGVSRDNKTQVRGERRELNSRDVSQIFIMA